MSAFELTPGRRIAEWVLEERLGRGGFGEVWRARHHAFEDRRVAVKVPGNAERAALLKREGALQDRVRHPHAVEVIGMDADHDPPYLVMELVEGESLRRRIEREKRVAPAAAAEIAVQVLSALEHAHARGVVHRDVKPENVLLGRDGRAKLTDFGLGRALDEERARLALSGCLVSSDGRDISGTVAYMAPEQREPGRAVDARADIYALGIVLFEMLAGVRPEGGEAPSDLVGGLDPRFDEVFRKCYCRIDKRYPSAAAAIADLAPLAAPGALVAAGGALAGAPARPAHLVPLRPVPGSPVHVGLTDGAFALPGGAEIRFDRGSFWVKAPAGAAPTFVVPGTAPAGRRPEEFKERVGAAPLRLSEGMIIRIGEGEGRDVTAFGFHDGSPAPATALAPLGGLGEIGWLARASGGARVVRALGTVLLVAVAAAAGATAYEAAFPPRLDYGPGIGVVYKRKPRPETAAVAGLVALVFGVGAWRLARAGRASADGTRGASDAGRDGLPLPPSATVVTVSPVAPPLAPPTAPPIAPPVRRADEHRPAWADLDHAYPRPAGFWIRTAALCMDVALFAFVAEFLGPRTPIAILLYDWLATAAFGATIGKYVCGIRIVRWDGAPVGVGRALLRTASKVLSILPFYLGYALAAVTPGKQALHDFLSQTRAVRIGGQD
jgi:hypothetical protein